MEEVHHSNVAMELEAGAKAKKSPAKKSKSKAKASKRKSPAKKSKGTLRTPAKKSKGTLRTPAKKSKRTWRWDPSWTMTPARRQDFLMRIKLQMITNKNWDPSAVFRRDVAPKAEELKKMLRQFAKEDGIRIPTDAAAKKEANKWAKEFNLHMATKPEHHIPLFRL